jgi:hypothetical protein
VKQVFNAGKDETIVVFCPTNELLHALVYLIQCHYVQFVLKEFQVFCKILVYVVLMMCTVVQSILCCVCRG